MKPFIGMRLHCVPAGALGCWAVCVEVNWEVTHNSCVEGESGERSCELREKPQLFGRCGMVCSPG